ncbi:MAG: hypothetical protein HETSPECPRED_000388 [Heterodermia speciosa]|uniref:Cell division cycle protein 123 n=1 Tax=Heterodermia speciosa TaxID=116794 RepID=A0A8H3EZD4_9LECA|nr:MAG: hypothetical protein HETSPECPRED_000388 [Heterodermia speciosa]
MPSAEIDLISPTPSPHESLTRLPFPPITRSHILHCSYHYWHPRYRTLTPKARLIPLSKPFIDYLRADGIVLPAEEHELHSSTDNDSGIFSASTSPTDSDSEEDEEPDPSLQWLDIHQKIKDTITELKGSVHPKLNWSAPKDATWIAATNSMECRTANDVYLLLKSSDFITHDLEQAYDGCEEEEEEEGDGIEDSRTEQIPYHLVLRQTIPALVTSLELRCFVRGRELLCVCQRDLNHYAFLPALVPKLRGSIADFFENNLRASFPDDNFVYDVYVPPPHDRTWLIDINPWAPRTDPLLFSWLEILQMTGSINEAVTISDGGLKNSEEGVGDEADRGEEIVGFTPEFRLVNRDDPEAYSFNTPQYSAHKLPKDVVDASGDGEAGLRDFMGQWRDILRKQEADDAHEENRDT